MFMKAVVVAFALFVIACAALAQPRDVGFQGYTRRLWEARDGLPDQTAQAFAQTRDGSLWIGTKGGLLRFDGARFTSYGRDVAPAALERGVNCLLAASDGNLWIGTEGGGLIRYSDGRFSVYPSGTGQANAFIRAIFQDRDGNVWVGADQGLFRVSGSVITRIDGVHGTPTIFARTMVQDKEGHIWVGGTTLLEFAGSAFLRQYPLPGGPSLNLITALYAARDGTLWAGTLSGTFRVMPSGALSRWPGIVAQVSVLRETSDGTLWVGTIGQGLFYRRREGFFHIASRNLPSGTVNAVFEDREENIWLGTQAGVIRLSSTPVSIVPFPGGADSEFETLSNDTKGTIWVAASAHLFRITDGVARPYSFPGLPKLRVRTLVRDSKGGIWIGTDGAGLLHIEGNRRERFTVGHGLINDFVRAILVSKDGSIWAGTDGGLTHLWAGHSQNYSTDNGLAYFSVTALVEDSGGDIWVGTSRGLTHISRGRIVHDGATRALEQEQLWSICQDASGEIWFGTSDGLYGYHAGKLKHITVAQGLASNSVYEVLDDLRGNIWLGGPSSISRLRRNDLDSFHAGSRVALTFYVDSTDLDSAEFYSGLQPEGAVSSNGDVWFPSNKGAVHIAAGKIVPAKSSPIRIEEVRAGGQPLSLDRDIVLPPGNPRLEISYAVIDLGSQEGFRYRYEMEGLEAWNEVFNRRTAYYTHLPPGRYRFRVQAFEVGNPDAVSEASVVVVQRPHLYATPWFLLCCLITLLGLGFLFYRIRLRQMRMRFDAVSEERTRVAREMHDTVIQGCVGVSTLLEAALGVESTEEPLRQQLLNYATDQIRTTIESAREAVWALRSASSSAEDAGSQCMELARHFQAESGIPIGCRISGDPFKLGNMATHELLMTVREALANAVAHARAKSISMDVCFMGSELKVAVEDDGCGFDASPDLHRRGHYGILGMHERVRLLRGVLVIESVPGHGTKVCITVPRRQRG
jgi:ligand-binding sensor domain-containing protein/signal transduction histidine kinase